MDDINLPFSNIGEKVIVTLFIYFVDVSCFRLASTCTLDQSRLNVVFCACTSLLVTVVNIAVYFHKFRDQRIVIT